MFIRQWVIFIVGLFSALILASTSYAPAQSLPTSSSTLTNNASSVTVQLNDRPLFVLQTKGGSPSIEQRALEQQHRIEQFAKSTVPVEALHSSDIEGATLVAAEDVLLFAITDKDAQAVGKTRQILAREYIQKLQQAVNRYREERSVQSRIRASIIAILSTLGLLLILTFLNKITPQIDEWLDERRNRRLPNIQIQSLELVSSSQLSACLKILTKLFRRVLTLAAIFGYLALVLSLFPATRKLGKTLWSLLLSNLQRFGQAFINYLPNLMSIVLIIIIAHYLIRFSYFFFSALSREVFTLPRFYPEWAQPTHRLLTYFIIALAFASSYFYLPNSNSAAFQGVSIFIGALLSLGATNAIGNLFAGIILIYTRAFWVGDRIEVAGKLGDVEDKNFLVTRIRTLDRELVTIPNSILLSNSIINYTALIRESNTPLILHTTVTLGYDVPWRKLHKTLINAALATTYILDNPKPFVLQTSLDDFYVSYELKAFTNHPEKMEFIYSELHQNIQDKCNEEGIEIMSPQYTSVRDGNQTTIPENHLPADYTAPKFQIDFLKSPSNSPSRLSDDPNSSTSK